MKITCNSNIVGKEIIEKCCKAFFENVSIIIVEVEKAPKKLDFSLIGYFVTFKQIKPRIKLSIKLKYKEKNEIYVDCSLPQK